jgi:hypothetical protein
LDAIGFFRDRKKEVLSKWRDAVFASYPPERTQFLKTKNDPFGNPVGHQINEGLAGILDYLLGEAGEEDCAGDVKAGVSRFLDAILRIRAVQDFTASQAVEFLFALKDALRDVADAELEKGHDVPDTRVLDRKVDALALEGFDIYCACREHLYEIRVREVKNLSYLAMKRANLVREIPGLEPSGAAEEE